MFGGCSKEENEILRQAEMVLPGTWKIESVQLPKYGLGVTYQGNTFVADTILYNIGSIEIQSFSTDTLDLQYHENSKVNCNLFIEDDFIPISLNKLFLSGEDLFSYFRYNGPDGFEPIDNPGEEFFYSSHIFYNNYIIRIIDSKNVKLLKASDQNNTIISLTKN